MANPEHVQLLLDRGRERPTAASLFDEKPKVELAGADLADAQLRGLYLQGANLDGADLRRADLSDCQFFSSSFAGAKLEGAEMIGAVLGGCQFTNASLNDAVLAFSRWTKVDLSNASIRRANLSRAEFEGVVVNAADFAEARANQTTWLDVDLRLATNLDQIIHLGPSSIGLDTIVASQGRISETFLRGCGLPDEVIAYVQSIGQRATPLLWHSCFLSFSSRDQDFCQRLYTDLQAAGVRCWFAPESLKTGDDYPAQIQSAIRAHDKLLLVLSDSAVGSSWVQREVDSAMEHEKKRGAPILFPIRLDGAVFQSDKDWAGAIRQRRHIANFEHWKDHDAYKRAFDRLLRDLRAELKS